MPFLLERRSQLDRIRQRFDSIAAEGGAMVVVSGEAGIGKTSLLRAFIDELPAGTPVLSSGCEALFTPRPLGPLVDLGSHFPPSIERWLHEGRTWNGLFPALLRHLGDGDATRRAARVLIIEDLQWADAGTIDFVRYLGRRMRELPLLFMISRRDEALDDEHPLHVALADLPAATTLRIALQPLSRDAVARLAHDSPLSADKVYAATGGNPFYVTELLALPDAPVPPSVRDAVLGALARLSPPARDVARTVSLMPGYAELVVIERCARPEPGAVDECLRAGILAAHGGTLAFRHEIARTAVHDALPPLQRAGRHAAAYRAWCDLASGDEHGAHRLHHAEAAGLLAEAAALAPAAARRASTTGDHREAARLYRLALDATLALDDQAHAALLEAMAYELVLNSRLQDAIAAHEEALAIRDAHSDRLHAGINQRWLARLHWLDTGVDGPGPEWARRAIDTLAELGPTRDLAIAYGTMSHLCLMRGDMDGAHACGLHAVEIAEDIDDAEAMCQALNNVAVAILAQRDDPLAWERLARSLAIALEQRLAPDAARTWINLFTLAASHFDFARAWSWARECLDHCEAHGLDMYAVRTLTRRALAYTRVGRWSQAQADLDEAMRRYVPAPSDAAVHAFVSSLLAMREGGVGAIDRLRRSAEPMRHRDFEIGFVTTAAAALAEAAWLESDRDALVDAARTGLEWILATGHGGTVGELVVWLRRGGADVDVGALPALPTPYALEFAGRPTDAAREWQRLGCPYESALALAAGDDAALTEALAIFESLGAKAAAARVREMLRERGVSGVPRGPMPRTRDDPLNLTGREREIFELLRKGTTNAMIAQRLHRSERTVEHHVSTLLRKLGLRNRVELLTRFAPGNGSVD